MSPILDPLPRWQDSPGTGYLYAVELSDGRVKIGVTRNPRTRCAALATTLRARVVRAYVEPCAKGSWRYEAERAVLAVATRMSVPSRKSVEVFEGLKFGHAATAVRQMARRKFDMPKPPSQTPAGRKAAAQRRLEREAATAARLKGALDTLAPVFHRFAATEKAVAQ